MFSKYLLVAAVALFLPIESTSVAIFQRLFPKLQTAFLPFDMKILDGNSGTKMVNNNLSAGASADHRPDAEIQTAAPNSPPVLASWDHLTGAIRLHFVHAEGGIVLKYQPGAFQIAGADRKWYWADAHALGDVVIVSTSLVQNPVAVRYDWQSNQPAILFNKVGLSAGRFRTDDWPDLTAQPRPN